MDELQISESELDAIADRVAEQLPTGEYGCKMLLSRRQLLALASGGLSVGALTSFGVDEATAQDVVGQVGTDSDRVDVFAGDVTAAGDVSATALDVESVSTSDTATDPSANGEIRRNGTDVKVYSGGDVRNLTNIGSGSSSVWDDSDSDGLYEQDQDGIEVPTVVVSGSRFALPRVSSDPSSPSVGDIWYRTDLD